MTYPIPDDVNTMIPYQQALELVLSQVSTLEAEEVPLVESVGRVAAADLCSDVDISPFDHAAMDGFAMKASSLASACADNPVQLKVIAEVPAGSVYEGPIAADECVRIMTGAPLPAEADAVVKYEIVDYLKGDGREGSVVAFTKPAEAHENVRNKGEEIAAGQVAIHRHEVITAAGVGFLASCGIATVPVFRRPEVGVISIGSELVDITCKPEAGTIRDGNSHALCACVAQAGGTFHRYPTVPDDLQALTDVVLAATEECDFVLTSGGASNGDYDFIKPVVEANGTLLMTLVNMRPGKAQTFGIVNGTPVFGLPGNPAAAYCGFEILARQALRKMQGFTNFQRPQVKARMASFRKKKDPRVIFLRATLQRRDDGDLWVTPAKNQSSGLFGTMQQANCLAIMPAGTNPVEEGAWVDCVLLHVEEGTVL
ncbi:MAG: gephyrin-like molybdotransferase Glp [Eggerthellaceae bacterium]